MSTNLKIALVGLALVSGAVLVWRMQSPMELSLVEARSEPKVVSAMETDAARKSPAPVAEAETERARTVAIVPPAREAAADAAPTAETARVRGRVLDLDARPVGGVAVVLERGVGPMSRTELDLMAPERTGPARFAASSDAQGRFEMDVPPSSGELAVREDRYTTVLAGQVVPGATEYEPVIVVAPRLELAGRVIDESGRPLASARVVIALPKDFRTSFADILDYSTERGFATSSDAAGRFVLEHAPRIANGELHVRVDGYLGHVEPLPATSTRGMEIVLSRQKPEAGVVSGQVVDDRGELVREARVAVGEAVTQTDEQGSFALKLEKRSGQVTVTALKPGHLPATQTIDSGADPIEFLLLKLGPPPLSIHGRVLDSDGQPEVRAKVWITEPTPFGEMDGMPASVEALLGGAATRADIEALLARAPEGTDPMEIFRDTPTVFWNFSITDGDGRFHMQGLIDRTYDLYVMDTATLLRVKVPGVSAGRSDLVVTIPAGLVHEKVAGHVISRSGKPIPGVTVAPMCDVISVAHGGGRSTMHTQAASVRTDENGYFSIEKFPRQEVYLRLDGESILPMEFGRGEPRGIESVSKQKLDELELVVATRVHVQVELPSDRPDIADEVRFLDTNDEAMPINVFMGNSRKTTDESPIVGGRSHVMVVTDDAATLVLWKEGKEVRRVPLQLSLEGLNVVRP